MNRELLPRRRAGARKNVPRDVFRRSGRARVGHQEEVCDNIDARVDRRETGD
jgi:hypothetical protein